MERIKIIGCGPGGKDGITLEALKHIQSCDVFIGSARALKTFAPKDKLQIVSIGDHEGLKQALKENQEKIVGVLVTGDPGMYSLAKKILEIASSQEALIIPGVSSLQTAFARIHESYENVQTFTFHGRNERSVDKILLADKAAIFCDRHNSAKKIIARLFPETIDRRCFVLQHLTMENEKTLEIKTLNELETLEEVSTELLVLIKAEG